MDHFERLPEGCVSEILSLTSVLDVLRLSTTSKAFKSACESDHVWERFLPRNWREIVSMAVYRIEYSGMKDLYFSLCHNPILIDGGKMSFCVDKRNAKKCIMIGARELQFSWSGCWDFTSQHPTTSRFPELARLRSPSWIHIQGKLKTEILSENTIYAAYLVFCLDKMDGLRSSDTVVRILNHKLKNDTCHRHFESRETGKIARVRRDGWMEIEMGKFFNGSGDYGMVEAWLIEIHDPHGKSGLLVEGIEFRPV